MSGHSAHLRAIAERFPGAKPQGAGFVACCPAHQDRTPSLRISEGRDGRVLLHCHAQCPPEAVCAAVGLTMADLFPARATGTDAARSGDVRAGSAHVTPAPGVQTRPRLVKTYDYHDASGALRFQVCRFEPKTFRQRRPDGNGGWIWSLGDVEPVLYRLADVIQAVADDRPIYLVEGEKDADTLAAEGYCATTCPMGAGKWREAYAETLARAFVVVLPDNDDVGRGHAEQAAASLTARGATVRVIALPNLPPKGDVSDWLNDGHTLDELDAIVASAPRWTADELAPETRTRWRLDEVWDDDAVMRPPPPIVPRLAWAGRSTLLAAAEKTGKSTLTGYVAAAVSQGGAFLDEVCQRGTVLIVGLEEFIGDAARRLRKFGADGSRVYLVDRLPNDPKARPGAVRAHVDAVQPALVIIDTLIAYGDGLVSDAGSSSQMGPLVQQLTTIAHETGTALVLVHHARKADGKYRDSSAIGGAVDVIIEVFAPEEDTDPTLRKARARGRVPCHDFSCRFDGTTYLLVSGQEAPLDQRLQEFVRANPGASLRTIRHGVTGTNRDIDDTLTRLTQAGRLVDRGSGASHAYYLNDPRPTSEPRAEPLNGRRPVTSEPSRLASTNGRHGHGTVHGTVGHSPEAPDAPWWDR